MIPQILHVHALRRQENKKVLLTYWYYTAISAISTIQEFSDSDGRLQVAVTTGSYLMSGPPDIDIRDISFKLRNITCVTRQTAVDIICTHMYLSFSIFKIFK